MLTLGRRCVSVVGDVRSPQDMEHAVASTASELGALDHRVCNAGLLLRFGKVHELSPEQWRPVLATNLTGVFITCRAVLPPMMARRRGTITITASTAGRSGFPNLADYNSSKWGVIGLMKSMASEYGIRVNCVAPSNVNSGELPSMTNNPAIFGHRTNHVNASARCRGSRPRGRFQRNPLPGFERGSERVRRGVARSGRVDGRQLRLNRTM